MDLNPELPRGNAQLIYLHGYNSSPLSHKAQLLAERLTSFPADTYFAPPLPPEPLAAMALLTAHIEKNAARKITLVGSSLGGYYATYLAETFDLKAVLVNPAVRPYELLRGELGVQRNYHTNEVYEFTEQYLQDLAALEVAALTRPNRYLLMLETGDEVLDYRAALSRYAGAEQVVIPGGDHSFQSFPHYIDLILKFAEV